MRAADAAQRSCFFPPRWNSCRSASSRAEIIAPSFHEEGKKERKKERKRGDLSSVHFSLVLICSVWFGLVQLSLVQFWSVQFGLVLFVQFCLAQFISAQLSSFQLSSDQFSSVLISSLHFTSVVAGKKLCDAGRPFLRVERHLWTPGFQDFRPSAAPCCQTSNDVAAVDFNPPACLSLRSKSCSSFSFQHSMEEARAPAGCTRVHESPLSPPEEKCVF